MAGDLPLAEAGEAAQRDGAFVWLGVYEPSEEEFDAVRREFDLHELAVEDAVNAHQRPKVELYGDTLLVVLKTVRYLERRGGSRPARSCCSSTATSSSPSATARRASCTTSG